jgi:hypothetical protein
LVSEDGFKCVVYHQCVVYHLSEKSSRSPSMMIFGVDVIVVAPGTIATPIWNKADAVDVTPFADTSYAPALARLKA